MLVKKSLAFIVMTLLPFGPSHATSVSAFVYGSTGAPVADAVVYAEPVASRTQPHSKTPATVEIVQKARKFTPSVTVVNAGTSVSFPNQDTVRHHVYSFSPAKSFELKLYSGVPATPVTFDKPGTVVLGCNIHDKMIAYVRVVNTTFFAKTDASGRVLLTDLPAGEYLLKAWHYTMPSDTFIAEQRLQIGATQADATFTLNVPAAPVQ